jgi:hypothetical protein
MTECLTCGQSLTPSEQQAGLSRLTQGMSMRRAKLASPRCWECAGRVLRSGPRRRPRPTPRKPVSAFWQSLFPMILTSSRGR